MKNRRDHEIDRESADRPVSKVEVACYILKQAQAMLMMAERVPELEGLLEKLAIVVEQARRDADAAHEYFV